MRQFLTDKKCQYADADINKGKEDIYDFKSSAVVSVYHSGIHGAAVMKPAKISDGIDHASNHGQK